MKKSLLFALIGGIIIFAWQFISYAIPNFHKSAMEYTPVQDEVLAAIEKSGMKEGMYMLGQVNPEIPKEGFDKAMKAYEGKPWGILNYQLENTTPMAMNMIRGFIIAIIISLIFFWVIRQQKNPTLIKRVLMGVGIGFMGFLFVPYTNYIWFQEPDIWAYMLDGIAPWAILGFIGHKMA